MKTAKVEAIVLRTDNFGDADKVVTLFTRQFGKLEANAYGCRRPRNYLSGALIMFNHIEAQINRANKISVISEAEIINHYDALTNDLERMGYASFLFETVNRLTLPLECDKRTFELLRRALSALNERNPKIAALMGACQFMETSGVQLSFNRCVNCGRAITGDVFFSLTQGGAICQLCKESARNTIKYPETLRQTFNRLLNFDWHPDRKLYLNTPQLANAWQIMTEYLEQVIGSALRSLKFIKELERFHE